MQPPIDHTELNDRERAVLERIIVEYVHSATPVGSRTISKLSDLGLSPASIRNVMADLEEKGFLGHPHTSAGRVPTDKGYRFYVNRMMPVEPLTPEELETFQPLHEAESHREWEETIRDASRVLNRITHQLAIITGPSLSSGILERIELVPLSTTRLLVVLSIGSGLVKTMLFEVPVEVRRETLDQVTSLLNERLSGSTLRDIRDSVQERFRDASDDSGVINLFLRSSERLFTEAVEEERLHIEGMRTVMEHPEFGSPDRIREILELLENQNIIVHVLRSLDEGESRPSIRIGSEIAHDGFRDCSIVAAPYRIGNLQGTVSIIGPRRMYYPKIIAIVDYLARTISL